MNKLSEAYLLNKKKELDSKIAEPKFKNNEAIGRDYRRRADVNINLYLTQYVLNQVDACSLDKTYNESINDYQKAIEFLKLSPYHSAEAILAYGNALKEQFLPLHRKKGQTFCNFEKAEQEYKNCVELTLNIDYLRYYYFTMLEQMNLDVRKRVWAEKDLLPKRIVIFHSLQSPLSHQYLKGVYYFAYKNFVEVWEYNYGRIPDSDNNEHFVLDRLLDASGVVFLCSPEYNKQRTEIIKYEIQETIKLKRRNDPLGVFVLDMGNEKVLNELRDYAAVAKDSSSFETKIENFLKKNVKDIYCCRKSRCQD